MAFLRIIFSIVLAVLILRDEGRRNWFIFTDTELLG